MALPATDTFTTGSDQTLTAYSANWTNNAGAFYVLQASDDVHSNSSDAECAAHWNADTFADNQYAECKKTALIATHFTGPAVRCHASANTYYGFYADSTESYLFKVVTGTWTQLAADTTDSAVNDVLYLEASGTTITPNRNGSTTGTPGAQTDNAIASGYAGLSGYSSHPGNRVDDWEGGNLGAATQDITPALISSTVALYGPTITTGAVTVSPTLIASTVTLYEPTVTQGGVTQDVTPDLIASTVAVYTPQVNLDVAPDLIASTVAVYEPQVNLDIAPALIASTVELYEPTFTGGVVTIAPALIASTVALYEPVITVGAVTVIPTLIAATSTVYEPQVNQDIAPALIASTVALYTPQVNLDIAPALIASTVAVYGPVVTQGDIYETFEATATSWLVNRDTSGTGATVERSSDYAAAGTYAAKCFTTNSSSKAQVRVSFSSPWSGVPGTAPGEFNWQRCMVYVPAATIAALSGAEYIDIAAMYNSGAADGWFIRLKADGAIYCVGPSSGQQEFACYGTFPTDEWVNLELGLHSQDIEAEMRAFMFLVNGDAYGWYRLGTSSTDYGYAAAGIVATNSADDLAVYVDQWYLPSTASTPEGSDNRPAGTRTTLDFRNQDGRNIDIQYATWAGAGTTWLNATRGIGGWRSQAGPNSDLQAANLGSGWAIIELDWTGGTQPAYPPDEVWGTYYFAAMVAFKKYFPAEENLEIVFLYDYDNSDTVELTYESWVTGLTAYDAWEVPVATVGGGRIPEPGDKILVRWEESGNNLIVTASYYDASTTTWYLDILSDTRAMNNEQGVNWLDDNHNSVSVTTETTKYTVRTIDYGTLATEPQFIVPSLIASTVTVYTPQVNLDIAPSLIAATNEVYTPIVTVGAVTIIPTLIDSTVAVYEPQVNLDIAPELIASTVAVYEPVITVGAATVAPELIASTVAVYEPTITGGVTTIAPALIASTVELYEPVITTGAVTVIPTLIDSTVAVYNPQVNLDIAPDLIASTVAVYPPVITGGTTTIAPELITATSEVYEPTVTPGTATIIPTLIDSTVAVYDPQVNLDIAPNLIAATSEVYPPVLTPGAVTVAPELIASTVTVYGPTVYVGSTQVVEPTLIASTVQVFMAVITTIVDGRVFRVVGDTRTWAVNADARTYTVSDD